MSQPADDAWTVIDRIAEDLGVLAEARRKWRTRGVAHRYRLAILDRAREAGIEIDASIFDGLSGDATVARSPHVE